MTASSTGTILVTIIIIKSFIIIVCEAGGGTGQDRVALRERWGGEKVFQRISGRGQGRGGVGVALEETLGYQRSVTPSDEKDEHGSPDEEAGLDLEWARAVQPFGRK